MDAKLKPNLLNESTYPSMEGLMNNGDEVRRPRIGGFLAGVFYAAAAGAFSAS